MMGPTDSQIEQYFWGEELPPRELEWCEERVANSPELLRNYHQVQRLLRRFKMLRKSMRQSEEAERHLWFARSLGVEPVPLELRTAVNAVIEELFKQASPTPQIENEVIRRIGDLNEQPEAAIDRMEVSFQRDDSQSLRISRSALSASLDYGDYLEPARPSKLDPRRAERAEIRVKYPELVRFMRREYPSYYDRWDSGNTNVKVLGRLHSKKGQPALMAGLELLDLVSGFWGH